METMTVTIDGTTYSVVAVQNDEGTWNPGVAIIDATGEPTRTVVDAETTDEEYSDARSCLLRAMAHIV